MPVFVEKTVTNASVVLNQTCRKRRPVSLKFSIKGVKMYNEDETVRTAISPQWNRYAHALTAWSNQCVFNLKALRIKVNSVVSVFWHLWFLCVLLHVTLRARRPSWWLTPCVGSLCPPPGPSMPNLPSSPTTRAAPMPSCTATSFELGIPER